MTATPMPAPGPGGPVPALVAERDAGPSAALHGPDIASLHGLWLQARQGRRLPRRADLDIAQLAPMMGTIALVERDAERRGGQLRFRLAGAGLERFWRRPLHQAPVAAATLGPEADSLTAAALAAWRQGRPVLTLSEYRLADGGRVLIERLVLPLRDRNEGDLALVAEFYGGDSLPPGAGLETEAQTCHRLEFREPPAPDATDMAAMAAASGAAAALPAASGAAGGAPLPPARGVLALA